MLNFLLALRVSAVKELDLADEHAYAPGARARENLDGVRGFAEGASEIEARVEDLTAETQSSRRC
jgi:hypothetical protein